MTTIGPEGFRALVNAAITAVSILGGAMAYASGYAAAQGLIEGCDHERAFGADQRGNW